MGKTIRIFGFPSNEPALKVKDFLEQYTGVKSIYALVIKPPLGKGRRALTIIQFTRPSSAQLVISLITRGFCYKGFYLQDSKLTSDIVPKPRILLLSVKKTNLSFGCQVFPEKFHVLWDSGDVVADFESEPVKISFFLSHLNGEYKIELSRNSIWQIQLRRPSGGRVKFLLIQIFGGPRIYKRFAYSSEYSSQTASSSYFMDSADDEWVRTTDFSPSSCIGQSSAVCLELPYNCGIPDFCKSFIDFREYEGLFIMEKGSIFSHSLDLVPIIFPPMGIHLSFKILFKVSALVQNGCIPGPKIDADFFSLLDSQKTPLSVIESGLEIMYHMKECCYNPHEWLLEHFKRSLSPQHPIQLPRVSLDGGLVYVYKVLVTPTRIYFCGPEINVSNCVLRRYHEDIGRFLRVAFVDEDTEKLHSSNLSHRMSNDKRYTDVYHRILSVLKNGVCIGDKKFEFLAYAPSQLRDHSAWMFSSRNGLTAADIREWMGDFKEIRNIPKYAARLGQSFSSSTETLVVDEHEVEVIPDIESQTSEKYIFSDGIGKISAEFAKEVARKCGIEHFIPSAFQIRYGGYKGVVAVDPTSTIKLSLRRSMCKYPSKLKNLGVLSWTKVLPCFLNRQIITLLSTLGVEDGVFEKKQANIIKQLDTLLTDPLAAWEALEFMSQGETTNILREMLGCGYSPQNEPFLTMTLQAFRASKLFDLRTKARIFVRDARRLIGCLDETRTLEYGQVFVQVSNVSPNWSHESLFSLLLGRDESTHHVCQRVVLNGVVVVAKDPCLHPGDVRILHAVDVPSLHHMVDCIVFPQKGRRPHPNECSGSDLDGDLYFVSWDQELIPPSQVMPMDYTPPKPVMIDHPVTIEEVEEYFVNYMVNDCLGIISNAHLAFADKEPDKAGSAVCTQLAMLHSVAVDFAKTGIPATIPLNLQAKEFPDFMEKRDKPTYVSKCVIGKLFREVRDIASEASSMESFTPEMADLFYDRDMEVDGFEAHIDGALLCKREYDEKLWNMMEYFKIKTEGEIFSGYMSKSFRKYMDVDSVEIAVRALKSEVREWFECKVQGCLDEKEKYAMVSAWYHVTYHPTFWGKCKPGRSKSHFLSFPWCIYDRLVHVKREKQQSSKVSLSLLLRGMNLK